MPLFATQTPANEAKSESANSYELPTDNSLLALGLSDFVPFSADAEIVPTANSQQIEQPVGTRREWRIKPTTGELRGVSIREKNKGRKSVGWIDSRSAGWIAILASYEGWRRAARYAVGTFEQLPTEHDKQPTGKNHGNVPD